MVRHAHIGPDLVPDTSDCVAPESESTPLKATLLHNDLTGSQNISGGANAASPSRKATTQQMR
jgi:hypothetical protein